MRLISTDWSKVKELTAKYWVCKLLVEKEVNEPGEGLSKFENLETLSITAGFPFPSENADNIGPTDSLKILNYLPELSLLKVARDKSDSGNAEIKVSISREEDGTPTATVIEEGNWWVRKGGGYDEVQRNIQERAIREKQIAERRARRMTPSKRKN
ncbi:hypothetical protein ABW20_dc0102073 [Dactylellina cionopaga]|nr:hypothetical protein ABW20_dc0102073 [Dactylellina cionopaga]